MCRKMDELSRVCMAAAVAMVEGQNNVQSVKNCSGYRAPCWFPTSPPNDVEKINRSPYPADDESFQKLMYINCWINN